MTIKKFLETNVKSLLRHNKIDYLPKLVHADFLGHKYLVRNGTVDDCDYDDAWIHALAHDSVNIFDVGSNIGQSAFNMLHAPGVKNVVLIDPSPLALTIAADTLVRNGFGHRVRFVNAYVSDTSGKSVCFTGGYGTGGHLVESVSEGSEGIVTVPTMTVDEIAQLIGFKPDFVKFDVQGLEGTVLSGSAVLASERRTRFLIEMHRTEERTQSQTTQEVLDWCKLNAFSAWYLAEAIKIETTERVQHRGRYHLLLQPDDWAFPEWLGHIPQQSKIEQALIAIQENRRIDNANKSKAQSHK